MATSISNSNLLDVNLGIQGVLDAQESPHMPEANSLPSTILHEAGVDALFKAVSADKLLEQVLCPKVGDGSILQPQNFRAALSGSLENLKDINQPEVRSFVSAELAPLLENDSLLQAYSSLLIGG